MEANGAEPRDARDLERWRDALSRVLAGRDLEIVTQPVVDLATGDVYAYEALTRFPGAPSADPRQWFDAASEFGVRPELEAAALRRQLALLDHLPRRALLAVKVSGFGLDTPSVQRILERCDLASVVVELDDPGHFGADALEDDLADLVDLVDRLRARGARFAVASDGHGDVPVIVATEPDVVRLARPVVDGIDRDDARRTLVARVRELLGERDARLLAHGIESREELDALVAIGVSLGQGYWFAGPGPGWTRPTRRPPATAG